jgi:hypothetical protein
MGELQLLFEIAADPSKAVGATELFRDKTVASTAAIQAALQNAQIALEQGLGEFSAKTQLLAAGVSEAAAKAVVAELQMKTAAASSTSDIAEWAAALGTAKKGLSEAELASIDFGRALAGQGGVTNSVTEARIAAQGLAQDLGIHLPRAATSFLAKLPEIGPLLSVAFAPIAIIGLIEALGQVPKMFEKLEGAVTGWGETAKKEYEKQLELNDRYAERLGKTYEATIALAEARQKSAVATREEAEQTEVLYATSGLLGLAMEKLNIGPLHALLDAADKAQEKANELALKAAELQAKSFADYAKKVSQGTLADEHEKILKKIEEEDKKREEASKKQEHLRQEAEDKYANFWAARAKFTEHQKQLEEDATKAYAEGLLARIKYDDEMTKRLVDGIKKRLQEEEAADRQVKQITDENTHRAKAAAQDVIRASEQRAEAATHAADTELKIEESHLKKLLQLHKITSSQMITQDQQALDQWYAVRKAGLDRQLAIAKEVWGEEAAEYQKLIRQMEALDDEYAQHKQETSDQVEKSDKHQLDAAINSLSSIAGALKSHHALEISLIVARAAIKMSESIADSVRSFAAGDFVHGALYALAAADYGIVAGSQVASAAGGGGGGSFGGGGGPTFIPSQAPGGGLAPGASTPGPSGSLHVVVMGQAEGAQYLAGVIDHGVRYQGVKLTSSHTLRPTQRGS